MSERGPAPTPPAVRPWAAGLPVGRILGVPVVVQPLWFVIVAVFTAGFGPAVHDNVDGLGTHASYAVALGFVLLLYGSVLVHEIGHLVVARALGMQVRRVVLQFLGGATEIVEEQPGAPERDFLVAAAGPLTSVLLAGVGAAVAPAFDDRSIGFLYAEGFAWVNALVAAFNLLPGLPLDGGRALRAIVWRLTHDKLRAQLLAGWVGRAIALAVAGYALYAQNADKHGTDHVNGIYLLVLAYVLWANASYGIAQSKVTAVLPGLDLRTLMRQALAVSADLPVAEAVRRAQAAAVRAVVIVDSYGRPAGVVSESAVTALPVQQRPWVSVSELARPIEPGLTLRTDMSGAALLQAVQATPASEYLVVDAAGTLSGVLSRQDLVTALHAAGLR